MNSAKRGAVVFFLAAAFLAVPHFAGAVNTGTVGILPANPDPKVQFSDSWLIYHLGLGQSRLDAVRVLNNKEETVVVKLYAVDAVTTSDGSFALLAEDEQKKDMGSWVKLGVSEIEVPPKSEKLVPFSVKIPENTDVGDHMGGIVMQELENGEENVSPMGVKIITRVGIRIYETVPGEVKKDFELTKFDWRTEPSGIKSFFKDFLDINKRTVFFTGIKNRGNVRISPKVTIDVKNIFGMTVAHLADREMGVIFPREEIPEGTVIWDKAPIFGRYTVSMSTTFFEDGVGQGTKELVIWAIPYRIIFLLVILLALLFLAKLIWVYFQEASKEKMPIYTVQLGDNLADLEKKFVVGWKKLAKVNSIGKPFEIRTGERMFIPLNRKNKTVIEQVKNAGQLAPSILERSGVSGLKKKRIFFIVAVLLLAGGGSVWAIRARQNRIIHQEVPAPQPPEQAPKVETSDKTISGVSKKSSVNIVITTPAGADQTANDELARKFGLAGYPVRLDNSVAQKDYARTTIEFVPGKKDQADMVKNDLGSDGEIDLREVPDLGSDIVIYSFEPKNDLFSQN